jgi:hypothetical protein
MGGQRKGEAVKEAVLLDRPQRFKRSSVDLGNIVM